MKCLLPHRYTSSLAHLCRSSVITHTACSATIVANAEWILPVVHPIQGRFCVRGRSVVSALPSSSRICGSRNRVPWSAHRHAVPIFENQRPALSLLPLTGTLGWQRACCLTVVVPNKLQSLWRLFVAVYFSLKRAANRFGEPKTAQSAH